MQKRVDFSNMQKKLERLKARLPRVLANQMLNHSKKAFRDQGFTRLQAPMPWKPRKRGNAADRRTQRRRAILIDSGNLRRSLRVRSVGFRVIRVGVYGVPYASRHNRGLDGMPRRQFIGRSKALSNKMNKAARREFRNAFKA